jgi:hypothetical protein
MSTSEIAIVTPSFARNCELLRTAFSSRWAEVLAEPVGVG